MTADQLRRELATTAAPPAFLAIAIGNGATGANPMTDIRNLSLPDTLGEPAPGTLLIRLSNIDQGEHLHQALRGHCEAELVMGSNGMVVVVDVRETGSRNVLRRVDAWLTEFGVASATVEFNGRTYEMTKS